MRSLECKCRERQVDKDKKTFEFIIWSRLIDFLGYAHEALGEL